MSGLFITIEGGEGAGKSTQSRLLCEYFEQMKKPYLFVREPGATSLGEKIRGILLDKKTGRINHHAEIMLYAAARAQLMEEKIRPALEAGNTVICDRFLDSSVAYQGFGRGIELKAIYDINKYALLGTEPDITFFLDIFPAEAFSRKERDAKDRIESDEMSF
ncbi:MAG: dTMP kinase, partial [Firmicutes bacterium]|nr:dTMP kinase [Bacillota bacterium]